MCKNINRKVRRYSLRNHTKTQLLTISNENLGIMLKQATNRKEKTGVEGTAREFEVDE
jgi:hypothetical protein